jgi:hypothetical protein
MLPHTKDIPTTCFEAARGFTLAAEDEIGLAGKWLVAPPAGDAVGTENGGEPQLGGAVSGGADRGHDLRALLFGEHVGHTEIRSTKQPP